MTINRRGLAEEIDRIDAQISALQMDKRGAYEAYRTQLEDAGQAKSAIRLEVEAFKQAIREHRALTKDEDVVVARDALVAEILAEIHGDAKDGTRHATRARAPRASGDGIPDFLRRPKPQPEINAAEEAAP